jgi:hypothetical protein
VLWFPAIALAAGPKPGTLKAWDEYIQHVALPTKQEAQENGRFLWMDQDPLRVARAQRGEILASEIDGDGPRPVPHGLIHHWIGAVFIPGVMPGKVFAVVRDYDRYSEFYRPTVVDSALLCRSLEEERFRLRYAQKVLFVTEVLDSESSVRHVRLDARRWYSITQSTRLQEIADPSGPAGNGSFADEGSRYVWRIYSISRYEQRDGGVYVEQENIVLSRAIPMSLEWLVEPAIRRLSMHLTVTYLRQTREAVRSITHNHLPSAGLSAEPE